MPRPIGSNDATADVGGYLLHLLRLALPGRSAPAAALEAILARAGALGDTSGRRPSRAQLTALAVEEIAARNRLEAAWPPDPSPPALRQPGAGPPEPSPFAASGAPGVRQLRCELERHSPDSAAQAVQGAVDDDSLLVLVRALERRRRQAIALTIVYGVADDEAARAIGVDQAGLDELRREGITDLSQFVGGHRHRELQRSTLAPKPLPRLRPLPPGVNGVTVIRGTGVYVDQGPPQGWIDLFIQVVHRLIERMRHRHHDSAFDDDVGDVEKRRSHAAPPPTPTAQPIKRPKRTPSLTYFKTPPPTAGTHVHDRSPLATPSTARLSNPARPLARSGAAGRRGR